VVDSKPAVVPPRVDYALTPLGHTLRQIIDGLVAWPKIISERLSRPERRTTAGRAANLRC